MSTIMRPYTTHITGAYVAKCDRCQTVCAHWDNDDLDDNGNLHCHCDDYELAVCDNCGLVDHTPKQLIICVDSMLGPPPKEEHAD